MRPSVADLLLAYWSLSDWRKTHDHALTAGLYEHTIGLIATKAAEASKEAYARQILYGLPLPWVAADEGIAR